VDARDPLELARAAFGVAVEDAAPLPGEHDRNFALSGPDGRFVLKLHSARAHRAELELQDAALAHLSAREPGLLVPRLVGVHEGEGVARLLTWVEGRPWAGGEPHGRETLGSLGRAVGLLDRALADFEHPALRRPLDWNMLRAGALRPDAGLISDPERRRAVAGVLSEFEERVLPRLEPLGGQAIHNDANEHNVLLDPEGQVCALIDFGDLCWAPRVCGLAVACAYAMAGLERPLVEALPLVAGYHEEAPLAPAELELLFDLVKTRLAMSVCMAERQSREQPGNDYLLISQDRIWPLLQALLAESPELAHLRLRDACGYEAVPGARRIRAWLGAGAEPGPVCRPPPEDAAVGRYLDERAGDALHLGVDLFLDPGEPVLAPLDGVVHAAVYRPGEGGVVLLEHRTGGGEPFFTLYGHLDRASAESIRPGAAVGRGEPVGRIGTAEETGGGAPHVHLQVLTTTLGLADGVPGVAPRPERDVWESVAPDPNLLLGLPGGVRAEPGRRATELLSQRRVALSRALSISYAEPLHLVRGEGARLYDAEGRTYLDLVNNVCHVGHAHPRVVAAAAEQMARLNTNTRYLYDPLVGYARALAATLPDPLSVVFLVNSGSEANDLALRIARAHTGRRGVVVLEHAYHGNLSSLIEISPYKFAGPGGAGRPGHVRVAALPDPYRGAHGAEAAGYLADLRARLAEGPAPAAFVAESLPSVAGQIVFPEGYLAGAFEAARAAGAVCIADEVQVGFGRVGEAFWGFELQGAAPDIVTLGKPIGNGHPLGAVVASPAVARSFVTGMEYFNTFGGNPVSCAVGLAVLDVIRDERLQARALRLGNRLKEGLLELAAEAPAIGDVRGHGLFLGAELVSDRTAKTPDPELASAVVEQARARGVLLSTDGPDRNVLKLKPPLALDEEGAELCLEVLGEILAS
jgi:4-aminobutyrate aminotransferase-like enzyme/Ser/Thr protein kinase RdoA (MazF antagonist)